MQLRSISQYARELKPNLPARALQPAHSRLWWLPTHVLVISACIFSLAAGWVPWIVAPALSLIIGASFAGLTFLAHETLHGAVVRGLTLRSWVGRICFTPFMISPRFWIAWHNRVHHGNTNNPGVDPDAYPTLEDYTANRATRIVTDHLGPGGNRVNGLLSHGIGFSVQSAHMLLSARRRGIMSASEQRHALLESGLMAAGWCALGIAIGWTAFVFAFVLPLLVANAVVMGFILTNHSLSPHTPVNDPLVNSLSVTAPRSVEWLTLHFGFHVEHHIFPWMSSRHAPALRTLIRERWPERYQTMPLWRALLVLHGTGRVYTTATTLADMPAGKSWEALLPRAGEAVRHVSRVPHLHGTPCPQASVETA